ncbi:MAG: DUF6056 family protein [Planctomycetota bacterium]
MPRKTLRALTALCLLGALPFVALLPFNHPTVDDFAFAVEVADNGPAGSVASWYDTWSGRYFSFALIAGLHGSGGLGWPYKVLPAVLFAAFWLALTLLLRVIAPAAWLRRRAGLVAGIGAVLCLTAMPSTAQGLYWMAGSVTYTVGTILALLLAALLLAPSGHGRVYRVPAGVFLTVGVVGSNEVLMVYALLLIGAGAVFHQVRRRPGRGLWVVCFCTAALCSIVVLLAPGNSLRLGLFPDGRDIPHTVGRCLLMPWVLFARWSINPALLGLTVLALPLLSKWGRRAAYRPRRRALLVYGLIWYGLLAAGLLPGYWGTGHLMPRRGLNVVYVVHLACWFGFWFLRHSVRPAPAPRSLSRRVAVLATIAVGLGFAGFRHWRHAVWDLAVNVPVHERQVAEREELIREQVAAGRQDLELPEFTHFPFSVCYSPLTQDYVSSWYPRFLGVRSVSIVPRKPPAAVR